MRYVAFLRAINVGGHNPLKMDELCKRFISLGFRDVYSYKASGNVMFESAGKDSPPVIGKRIEGRVGVKVTLRTLSQIKQMVKLNPFAHARESGTTKFYVCFLSDKIASGNTFPIKSADKRVEVLAIKGLDAFCLAHLGKDGRYGYPTSFVETRFGVSATTRNWATVLGIAGSEASNIKSP